MDVLKVVQQLRDLAADPQNRATIVRDQGCLPGLVIFLDNDNPQVILTALEALYYLAQVPSNRPLMKNEVGLLLSVNRIINRQASRVDVRSSAQRVSDLLVPPAGSTRSMSLSHSRPSARAQSFLGTSNKKARLVVLQIEGWKDLESRRLIEDTLLGIKGVISFTFNFHQRRCSIRVRSDSKPEAICASLLSTGTLSAKQVIKNDNGEEVLLSFDPSPVPDQDEKENTKPTPELPDYLPEDDGGTHTKGDDKAIERSGAPGQGGWFSSVSSFLANSFYW